MADVQSLSFVVLDWIGTVAFAAGGSIVGLRKELDILGVLVCAFVTAVGGGTIRDTLLKVPVFWIEDFSYVAVPMGVGLGIYGWSIFFRLPNRTLLLLDAIGLGTFVVMGYNKSILNGCSKPIAIMMGSLSGVGGGMLRDVLTATVPGIFRSDIYALSSLIGGLVYSLLEPQIQKSELKVILQIFTVLLVSIIRLAGNVWHISLPGIRGRAYADFFGSRTASRAGSDPLAERKNEVQLAVKSTPEIEALDDSRLAKPEQGNEGGAIYTDSGEEAGVSEWTLGLERERFYSNQGPEGRYRALSRLNVHKESVSSVNEFSLLDSPGIVHEDDTGRERKLSAANLRFRKSSADQPASMDDGAKATELIPEISYMRKLSIIPPLHEANLTPPLEGDERPTTSETVTASSHYSATDIDEGQEGSEDETPALNPHNRRTLEREESLPGSPF